MKVDYFILMKKKEHIERFRGRIIFPIKSITGQYIAAGGRIITKDLFGKI